MNAIFDVSGLNFKKFASRFLMPAFAITIWAYVKFGAFVSIKAEVQFSKLMTLGKDCKVSSFTKIKAASGPLRIGARTSIATGCFIGAGASGTTIGDDCLIGPNCTILSGAYRYGDVNVTFTAQGRDSKGTRIGNNVLIGANSVVIDGSDIGDNVMISALSFVSGKIPKNAVVQGNPAQVIFMRR